MTLTEFLLKLHETPRGWALVTEKKRIRGACWPESWICPLSAFFGNEDYDDKAEDVGLPADAIMDAADNYRDANARLRRMLLWATGLDA